MSKNWNDVVRTTDILNNDINRQTIIGYFLISLGVDLSRIPGNFYEPYSYFPSKRNNCSSQPIMQKVYLNDILGTSYQRYAAGNVLSSFSKLKRITAYIQMNCVTKNKYLWMLKQKTFCPEVILSKNHDGKYFVDGNGNHRVLAYKMIMLAEIAKKYDWVYCDSYDVNYHGFDDISKKYWLYAKVYNNPD